MPRHYDLESYLLKKELVKNYHHRGLPIVRMVELLDEQHLFSVDQSYNARYSLVVRLLRSVRKEDSARFRVLIDDERAAWCEYVARQEFLYMKAVECGDYQLARKLSQDIAKAYGVPVEEPIKIETDILSLMGEAFALGEKRLAARRNALSSPPHTIEVVPSPASNGKVKG